MKFKLEFDMDNTSFWANFEGRPALHLNELSDIFHKIEEDILTGLRKCKISDNNGNSIGKWEIKGARKQ